MLAARTPSIDSEDTQRYRVSVWMVDEDTPIAFAVENTAEAAKAVLWVREDPRVVRVTTVDTLTNRTVRVWTR